MWTEPLRAAPTNKDPKKRRCPRWALSPPEATETSPGTPNRCLIWLVLATCFNMFQQFEEMSASQGWKWFLAVETSEVNKQTAVEQLWPIGVSMPFGFCSHGCMDLDAMKYSSMVVSTVAMVGTPWNTIHFRTDPFSDLLGPSNWSCAESERHPVLRAFDTSRAYIATAIHSQHRPRGCSAPNQSQRGRLKRVGLLPQGGSINKALCLLLPSQ